jgi:uncharacterized protein YbcI
VERAGVTRDTLERDITREVVSLLKEHAGRGPVGARAYVNGDVIMLLMREAHTVAEQTLIGAGKSQRVASTRAELAEIMRPEFVAAVERCTGRKVTAFLTSSHDEPDLLAHIYVLAPVER